MFGPFDRHTLLDLTVNAVPFAILVAFAAFFALYNPWGRFSFATLLQFALLAVPALGVAYVTYYCGLLISRSEVDDDDVRASEFG